MKRSGFRAGTALTFAWICLLTPSCSHGSKRSAEIPPPAFHNAQEIERAVQATESFLRDRGIPDSFLRRIRKRYLEDRRNWMESALKIEELNLFGFLYHGNYFAHDNAEARKAASRYLRAHRKSFSRAGKAYGVAPEAIAALMWVETKFGKNTGEHPLPWVFFSLSLASQPEFCDAMRARIPDKLKESLLTDKPDPKTADQKVLERCKAKAEWAAEELKVLSELERSGQLPPFRIKGSFAGAFGLPQFLPSSYRKYAVSSFRKKPDLFLPSDAILSIARYLHENGWNNSSEESQSTALYSYNRSRDYGSVIRQIAGAI